MLGAATLGEKPSGAVASEGSIGAAAPRTASCAAQLVSGEGAPFWLRLVLLPRARESAVGPAAYVPASRPMAMPPPPPPTQRRVAFADVPSSLLGRGVDSYVHDQGTQGTCYAQVAATLQRDAEQRAGLAVRSSHGEARSPLIQEYGIDGANLQCVLRKVVLSLNAKLGARGPASLRNCTADEAREVLRRRLGKLAVSFELDAAQWRRFSAFFAAHPSGILRRSDVGPRGAGPVEGHAVVIEAEAAHSSVLRGAGPVDSSKYYVLKNSWGATHAARGSLLVACDALDLDFWHIDLPERPTDLRVLFADASKVPRDLSGRVSIDESSRRLGYGSYGEVWRATLDGKTHVAVKTYKNGKQDVLLKETRRLMSLDGAPNVMRVLGMMRDGGGWALVMPIMDRDLRQSGAMDATQVALGLAKGLRAVHARGLIHCDVKDANVFLLNKQVVLGDFGCCIEASQHPKPTRSGTGAYRDPIVRSGKYGPEVDIYSFGKILDALLQRARYQSDELQQLAAQCKAASLSNRPTAERLVARLESLGGSSQVRRVVQVVRELNVHDLDDSADAMHRMSDSETRALGGVSATARMLTGTDLDTECRSTDRDFIVYVSSQGRYHHPTCAIVQTWHKQGGSTGFTKQTFAKICKSRRSKGCKYCQKHFHFHTVSASGRPLPCPVPLDDARLAVEAAAATTGPRTTRVPFSGEEDEYLLEGVRRFCSFGVGAKMKWRHILSEYPFLPRRTNVDLKDRWRNLIESGHAQALHIASQDL